jgi:hypothetical protein
MTTPFAPRRTCWDEDRRAGAAAELRSTSAFVQRSIWAEEWKRRKETAPTCRVCGRIWTPRTGVLHDLLATGARRQVGFDDQLPLCAAHHESLHREVLAIRRSCTVDLRRATYDALCTIQRRHREQTSA